MAKTIIKTITLSVVYEDDKTSSNHGYGLEHETTPNGGRGWLNLDFVIGEGRRCLDGDVKGKEVLKHIEDKITAIAFGQRVTKHTYSWKE